MSKYSIVKIIPYFGKWPEWMEFYIESCKANSDIDWLFFTDCPEPENKADNVRYVKMSFDEYKKMASEKLNVNFNPQNAYKLCDLRPAYGIIHQEDIANYDFYAYGDIDVIYGNIRQFITDDILEKNNVISTHRRKLSGHFTFFRNNEMIHNAFRRIPDWQKYFESEEHEGIDESKFSKVFLKHKKHPQFLRKFYSLFSEYRRNVLFKEQYSTILSPTPWHNGSMEHPQEWFWQDGKLTNGSDGDREFMYLHFMNWKSSMWLPKKLRDKPAAWMKLDTVIHMDYRDAAQGFQISPRGFEKIK